jgi:protease-4
MTATPSQPSRRRPSPLGIALVLSLGFFLAFIAVTAVVVRRDAGKGVTLSGEGRVFSKRQRVGVLEVNGVIRDVSVRRWLKQLRSFREDENVRAVVLRVNSPGGAVAPSQELYEAIAAMKKPVVASMGSVAASGGYYISLGAQKIFANPGTITGSIGVIMEFANLEKLYEWAKVQRFSIKTGKFKDAGADYRTMSTEERKLLQEMVDSTLLDFRAAVSSRRKLDSQKTIEVSDGRVFTGSQAMKAGLVDELGTLEEAVREAGRLAKIEGEPKVVYPSRSRRSFMEWILDEAGDRRSDDEEDDQEAEAGVARSIVSVLSHLLNGASSRPRLEPGVYWLLPWGY